MRNRFKDLIFAILLALSLLGCSKSSGSSDSGVASTSSGVTVTPTTTSLALGAGTTVIVSGGSGTYTSAAASEGTLYQVASGVYTYTAPTATSSTYITITVTDSVGSIGYAYLTLSNASSTTTTSSASCSGTYDASISGIAATIYLVGDASANVSGFIYMTNYYYPVVGTCVVGGAISLTNLSLGQPYTGTVGLTASSRVYITGAVTTSSTTYAWSALSRATAVTMSAPASSCAGTYAATVGANAGTLVFVEDGNNTLAGYLSLQGYYYALQGTCSGLGGTISFTNLTTGSPYYGTVSATGVMSGTFTTSSATYNWSASK